MMVENQFFKDGVRDSVVGYAHECVIDDYRWRRNVF